MALILPRRPSQILLCLIIILRIHSSHYYPTPFRGMSFTSVYSFMLVNAVMYCSSPEGAFSKSVLPGAFFFIFTVASEGSQGLLYSASSFDSTSSFFKLSTLEMVMWISLMTVGWGKAFPTTITLCNRTGLVPSLAISSLKGA